MSHQRRHADQLDVVGDGDGEALPAGRGIEEIAGIERVFDLLQRIADRRFQAQCARRRLHGAADAYQQRVVEQLAQAIEGIADRRLAERQPLCGAGDVAFAQQGVQHAKQVEVEVIDIHLMNLNHHKTKFQK